MDIYQLGTSDLFVRNLSLGCMSIGTNKQAAINIIHGALDSGINHLDTADLYDYGENETIIGEAIKHKREDIILTTKVGNHYNRQTNETTWNPSKKHIEQAVKISLQRLATDYIDLYMLHGGTIDDPIDETIDAFEDLKKSGLIRAYGISSIRPNVIRQYVERSNIDVVMMQYSLLDRRSEAILDLLHDNQISVLARGPLAKGILTNQSINILAQKAKDGFLDYSPVELHTTIDSLHGLEDPLQQLAFQYVLKHPAVASAVFGASTIDQLKTATQQLSISELDNDLFEVLQKLTKASQYTLHL